MAVATSEPAQVAEVATVEQANAQAVEANQNNGDVVVTEIATAVSSETGPSSDGLSTSGEITATETAPVVVAQPAAEAY